jgi:hypothetical protein
MKRREAKMEQQKTNEPSGNSREVNTYNYSLLFFPKYDQ